LVTPENVNGRGGWKVTPSGRIVRPMRMRPGHPLPLPLDTSPVMKTKAKRGGAKAGEGKEKKRRVKEPLCRARRRTINPLKWGSTQLKGVFLENAGAGALEERSFIRVPGKGVSSASSESEGSEEEDIIGSEEDRKPGPTLVKEQDIPSNVRMVATPTVEALTPMTATDPVATGLLQEKNAALGLLKSLFGNRNDDDWADRESLGSDVEMDDPTPTALLSTVDAGDDDIEEVPMEVESSEILPETQESPTVTALPGVAEPLTCKTKLKDLFAPQEQDGKSFSPASISRH
jgi:hypothetical protein